MSNLITWPDLPKELVDLVSNRLFSNVEHLRLRSICKSWRSAVATKKRFRIRNRKRTRKRTLGLYNQHAKPCLLSPAAFFRVILSSCPNKGWLIKIQDVSRSRKKLLSPLSRVSIKSSDQTLDLLKFTVSEIHQSYDIGSDPENLSYNFATISEIQQSYYDVGSWEKLSYNFARVVLVDNLVFAVDRDNQIKWCNSGASTNNWTRILSEEAEYFSDIIVHKDQIYALELKGAIWWISSSELNIYEYGPSTPMEYYEDIEQCKERRLVEYGGELCIVHRYCKKFKVKRVDIEKTIGFRVEMKSLEDKAIMMATDSCFSVLAKEYYGCVGNSIYFMDNEVLKVFKLGDGSIAEMVDSSSSSQTCFQMFSPPFA